MSEDEHSVRGPSGAHRWRRCPGSIAAERGFPDKVGFEAAEGTIFHYIAGLCLEFGFEPEDFQIGKIYKQDGYEVVYDDGMALHLEEGLALARSFVEPGDLVFVERRVDISPWAGEGQFGTLDFLIIRPAARKMITWDWKYGRGVPVSPIKNDQMYLYTLGGWNDFAKAIFGSPEGVDVEFHIEQPRAPGGGGSWPTTMIEVLEEGKRIREDALATMAEHAPRIAGEKQCQFCRASGNCAEQARYLLEDVFGQKFDDIMGDELRLGPAFSNPHTVPPEVASFVILNRKTFNRWVDQLHDIAVQRFKAGKDVPLLKLVAGRPGNRAYIDGLMEEATAKAIELVGENKAVKRELASPAQLEELIGKRRFKKEMSQYVVQPPGKPLLVSIDDKREPLQDYASKFDDFEETEDGEY